MASNYSRFRLKVEVEVCLQENLNALNSPVTYHLSAGIKSCRGIITGSVLEHISGDEVVEFIQGRYIALKSRVKYALSAKFAQALCGEPDVCLMEKQ